MPRVKKRIDCPSFNHYSDYRLLLREDFLFRCGYCCITEFVNAGSNHFHVEHYRPKSLFRDLENDFLNLLYACDSCNRYKSNQWPSAADEAAGRRFWNPRDDASTGHFQYDKSVNDGSIKALTPCAEYTIRRIRLNREFTKAMRLARVNVHIQFQEARTLLLASKRQLELGQVKRNDETEEMYKLRVNTIRLAIRTSRAILQEILSSFVLVRFDS